MSLAAELPLRLILDHFEARLPSLAAGAPRRALIYARYADALRYPRWVGGGGATLRAGTDGLDLEGWRRLALLVHTFDVLTIRVQLLEAALAGVDDVSAFTRVAFTGFAADYSLHTMELLTRSEHRREELARAWLLRAGVGVKGESIEVSMAALDRLDYARVLNDVGAARASAEQRARYVRRLQEIDDELRMPRRGKR